MWPWLLAAVIILVGLGGVGLIVSSFVPEGGLGLGQGGSASEEGGASSDESRSGSGGTDFDAVFVHRATAENISADNTYLDSDVINDNPDAILYVTPNWNPGGEGDTYNDHATGVWFDAERQRWAIFNQDREPMPEGAAFNVAVLEGPTE